MHLKLRSKHLKISAKLLFITVALYCFSLIMLQSFWKFWEVEFGFYINYAESIAQDFDLNILNNIMKEFSWIVSPSYNYPDMHDYGAPVLWSPFYYFVNLAGVESFKILNGTEVSPYIVVTQLFSLISFLLGFTLLKRWAKSLSGYSNSRLVDLSIIFGTGLFYYSVIFFTGADITLFFYSILCIIFFSNIEKDNSYLDTFLLGALFAFGIVIKIHFWTFSLSFAFFLFKSFRTKTNFIKSQSFLIFILGFLSIYLQKMQIDHIKFGGFLFAQGYLESFPIENILTSINAYFILWGPYGHFSQTPIIFISFLSFLFLLCRFFQNPKDFFTLDLIGLILYPNILIMFVMQMAGYQNNFAGRQLMVDIGAIWIMLNAAHREVKNKGKTFLNIFYFIVIGSIGWTLFNFFWDLKMTTSPVDRRMTHPIWEYLNIAFQGFIFFLQKTFDAIYLSFGYIPKSLLLNWKYLFLFLFPSIVILNLDLISNYILEKRKKSLRVITISIFTLFSILTGQNAYFNPINVKIYKEKGLLDSIVMGNGPNIFTFDNVLYDSVAMLDTDKYRKDKKEFEKKKSHFLNFVQKAKNEILIDNIGFIEKIENGQIPGIERTGIDYDSKILDFNAPSKIKDFD
jgi:hypothetical protein